MNNSYANMVSPGLQTIKESHYEYQCLTERHVQAMWFEQKYFRNLTTLQEEHIEVVSPGIWNAEAGPDFLKAHIKIGEKEYRGSVEIHLNDASWYQHHHHVDDRYNEVVLHLSLWKPKYPKAIVTHSGQEAIRTYLEDCLTLPFARILQLIDLDLYPYKKFIGSGRCAHELFRSLPESKTRVFFQEAADWRLSQKKNYLQARHSDPAFQLGAGIAMALGYKNNAEAFLELFIWLLEQQIHSEEQLLAAGMYACGFFEMAYQNKWKSSEMYQYLNSIANKLAPSITYRVKLVLNQIRPLNHPIRRLVVLSKMLSDPSFPKLYDMMTDHWNRNWQMIKDNKDLRLLRDQFLALFPTYEDSYWNRHYIFDGPTTQEVLTLMGIDLKSEILVNTFFPLLQERIMMRADPQEVQTFYNLYATIPASKTQKARYLIHRFFGDTPKGAVLNKAMMEQGAYQVHRDFCLHFEASCEGCPFVDRFKAVSSGNCKIY